MQAIVAQMQAQGYYAHLHSAKSAFIQKLTVQGLKSSHEHCQGGKRGGVPWSDMVAITESVVAKYFGEVPQGTQYVLGMSFVRPSGLAQVKQVLMHHITFHDAGHMKDAGDVPYAEVFMQTNVLGSGHKVVSCMTTYTCFNECKEGMNIHNQHLILPCGVQDEVRGVGGKIACPSFDSDSSVHIQDGGKGENASHRLFFMFALLFLCMRHLADSVQLQVSSVGRTLFKQAVKASIMVLYISPSSRPSLSSRIMHVMTRSTHVMCTCILFATLLLVALTAPP